MFHKIYYANKSLNGAQRNYTVTEQELLVVVYAFEKSRAYFVGNRVIVVTNRNHILGVRAIYDCN